MAKLRELKNDDGEIVCLVFHCPGCGYSHPFHIDGKFHSTGQSWEWNGEMDKPTFRPSLGVNMSDPAYRCHSFVTDGKIQFLQDSFHHLAGQTVDIPEAD
jgi:hypothetical protein